jgi:poly(A) polymerase
MTESPSFPEAPPRPVEPSAAPVAAPERDASEAPAHALELEPEAPSDASAPTAEADIPSQKLDPDAYKVVRRLRQHGHEAYLVGGCVRDLLLGRAPKDFDVATSALPSEVRDVFRNCRLIGRRFRLAHVYFKGGKIIEVSTFRANPTEIGPAAEAEAEVAQEAELKEEVDREGVAEVEAGVEALDAAEEGEEDSDLLITDDNLFGTAEQDARRRDFTVNGLFYDVEQGRVIDFVRGRRDLDARLIRTIGDPEIRLREDPVRILRAVRFSSKLELDIESRTYAAMEGAVEDLPRCAAPRLLEDTFRILRGGASAGGLKLLSALDALKYLLPPIDAHLKANGREAETELWTHAEALDRRVRAEGPLEDAMLLAVLLLPLARATPPPETQDGRPTVGQVVDELLEELVKNSRLPRRIAERCRMILFAQRTLSGERRRRGSLASFRRHPLFAEALTVFEISVDASGRFKDQLEAWKAGGAPSLPPPGPGEAPSGRRRRRRRRGGGRGGPNGDASGGSASVGDASDEHASEGGGEASAPGEE